MSAYVTDKAVDVAARVIHEYLEDAYDHEAAVAMTRAALRAYQALLDPSTTQERNHPMNHDETNGIMNDRSFDESFRAFQKRVGEINAANGWRTSPPDGATAERQIAELALITTEVAEAIEEIRNGRRPTEDYRTINGKPVYPVTDGTGADWTIWKDGITARSEDSTWTGVTPKPEGVPSELADVVIRAADFADHYGINLAAAIEEKLAYNATRGHRHGGKAI